MDKRLVSHTPHNYGQWQSSTNVPQLLMLAVETQPAWICSSPDPSFFYSVWRNEKHWEKPIHQYLRNTWRILMLRKPLQSITGIAIAQDKINVMEQLGRNFRISILNLGEDKQRHSCLCKKNRKSWSNMRIVIPLLVESAGRGQEGREGWKRVDFEEMIIWSHLLFPLCFLSLSPSLLCLCLLHNYGIYPSGTTSQNKPLLPELLWPRYFIKATGTKASTPGHRVKGCHWQRGEIRAPTDCQQAFSPEVSQALCEITIQNAKSRWS